MSEPQELLSAVPPTPLPAAPLEAAPLELAEVLRDLLEQSALLAREASALAEASARLRQAVRAAARAHLDDAPTPSLDLILAAGAAQERCAAAHELGQHLRAALAELPLDLREPPSPLALRARADLRRELAGAA